MNELYHHNALSPGSSVDEYRLIEVLGEGGFGIVYRGEGRYLGDQVAIKEYLPRHLATRTEGTTVAPTSSDSEEAYAWGLKKFQEEARILWNLAQPERHPNIVAVRRFFEANGTTYMVMDFEEARPLSELLKGKGTLSQKRLEKALFSLLNGLERVHEAGVWHRDIKPANILIRADGSPVLLDFGAARRELDSQTRSVVAAITPPYAAFEQYAARGNDGPWTDIYALGVTLFRCITGSLPPDAAERADEDSMIPLTQRDLPGYSQDFLAAVDRALAVRAKERPRSVAEWRDLFDVAKGPAAGALDEGGDTTILRASEPAAAQSGARAAKTRPSPLQGERERLPDSNATEGSSNRKLAMLGAAIAVVIAGVVGATMIDTNSLFGDPEEQAWLDAQQAGDKTSLAAYLRDYPDGTHSSEADALLSELDRRADEAQAEAKAVVASDRAAAEEREAQRLREAELAAWRQAESADSKAGYHTYLEAYPVGVHSADARSGLNRHEAEERRLRAEAEAKAKAEKEALAQAKAEQRAQAEQQARSEQQAKAEAARNKAEEEQESERQAWAAAQAADTVDGYQAYLEAYENGVFAANADERLAALQAQAADEAQAWVSASGADNVAAYREYVEQYPDGDHAPDAKARLDDLLEPVITETRGRYAARRSANIRNRPSLEGDVIGGLNGGDEVEVTARAEIAGETWLRIDSGGSEAYVYATLLREISEAETVAWNELRNQLDDALGEQLSPGEKADAISGFIERFPESHRVSEVEAEHEGFRQKQARIDAERALREDLARTAWTRVENSRDPEDFRAYLKDFPDSEFSEEAQASLDSLIAAVATEEAARLRAEEEARKLEDARRQAEAEKLAEALRLAQARQVNAAQTRPQNAATTSQTAVAPFPEPSVTQAEMQAFFEDKDYVLRDIVTVYNSENRIHVRGPAADPRAIKIFSMTVREALPPSVGDGRYVDVNFGVKDGRNEVYRPFRFGILWHDGAPEIISHSRLR